MKRRILGWGLTALALGLVFGGLWLRTVMAELEEIVEARFEGRLFELPTKVYSGPLVLYPGLDVESTALLSRLERLNYHVAAGELPAEGEYLVRGGGIEIHRRPFRFPHQLDPGGPVTLRVDARGRIWEIRDAFGAEMATVEIEPEVISQIRGATREDRRLVTLTELPRHVVDAVLATEDQRFHEHWGLAPTRIVAAALANLRAGRVVQGGSTITQQLVKNFYLTQERTFRRKLNEALMAVILERNHTKDEILEAYLNEVYMGQRGSVSVHGLGEAAYHYYAKSADDLTLDEAAVLAGMIKGPNLFSPLTHPKESLERRDVVLGVMLEGEYVDQAAHDEARARSLTVRPSPPARDAAPYFVEFLRQDLAATYGAEILESEGLAVYTTLDAELQIQAQRAVREGLARLEADFPSLKRDDLPLQAAVVALAPRTGEILAMVGGRDYQRSQFNRATQAHRQPGSVFKPVVALAALGRNGSGAPEFTPLSPLEDAPLEVDLPTGPWRPVNYDETFRGDVTLQEAIEHSLNVPVARLGLAVGPERIVATARRLGVTSPLEPLPSIALGAFELTPLEAARMYAVLASAGQVPEVRSYTELVDAEGNVVEQQVRDAEQAFDPAETYVVTHLLEGAVDRGTGRALRRLGYKGAVAGKTGTTSGYRDAWFIGFTPDIVIAVWVGFDDGRSLGAPGAVAALPIFADVLMSARGPGSPDDPGFLPPPGVEQVEIDPKTKLRASASCPGEPVAFLAGTSPTASCGGAEAPRPVRSILDWLRRKL